MTARRPLFESLRAALVSSEPAVLATVIATEEGVETAVPARVPPVGAKLLVVPGRSPEVLGGLGEDELDRVVERDCRASLERGLSLTRHYGLRGEARRGDVSVFIEAFAPPPELVIFGAVDFTAALASLAKLLGFRVSVCDPRPVFATPRRFPHADEVVVDWPDRLLARVGPRLGPRDAVCVLTHDTKFDVPAILAALRTKAGYIGAMGSRRTHAERLARLLEAGADRDELAKRLMSPVGIDIGARTPEETAVAICAEIIASRAGVAVPSLAASTGPIHHGRPPSA